MFVQWNTSENAVFHGLDNRQFTPYTNVIDGKECITSTKFNGETECIPCTNFIDEKKFTICTNQKGQMECITSTNIMGRFQVWAEIYTFLYFIKMHKVSCSSISAYNSYFVRI